MIITKKGIFVFTLAVLLTVVAAAGFTERKQTPVSSNAQRKIPVYCVETEQKKIALTFDAAWDDADTDEILNILSAGNAKATFFIVGSFAEKYPESVKKFYGNGHEIGNHSYNHTLYGKLGKEEIKADIEKCNKTLESITGERPKYLRSPSGDYTDISETAAKECGMRTVQWSVDSLDWQGVGSDEMAQRVISAAENGSIILFHNGIKNTPDALRQVIADLSAKGYEFVTLSDLLYEDNYRIDSTGRQKKAE